MIYTAKAPDITTDRRLWSWNKADVSQFTLDHNEAGSGATLSVETVATSTKSPWETVLKVSGTGDAGWRIWEINDFTIPASGRYIIRGILGPRNAGLGAVYGDGMLPCLVPCYQDGNHSVIMGRQNANNERFTLFISDNVSLDAGAYSVVNLGAGIDLGYNGDAGGAFEAEVVARHPDTGIDPRLTLGFMRGSSDQYQVEPGGWHSSWQSGGDLKAGLANFETGVAGASFFAELSIYQHPEDQ